MRKNNEIWAQTGQLGPASKKAHENLPEGEREVVDRLTDQLIKGMDRRAEDQRTDAILAGSGGRAPSGKVSFGEGSAREILAAVGKRMIELEQKKSGGN